MISKNTHSLLVTTLMNTTSTGTINCKTFSVTEETHEALCLHEGMIDRPALSAGTMQVLKAAERSKGTAVRPWLKSAFSNIHASLCREVLPTSWMG